MAPHWRHDFAQSASEIDESDMSMRAQPQGYKAILRAQGVLVNNTHLAGYSKGDQKRIING